MESLSTVSVYVLFNLAIFFLYAFLVDKIFLFISIIHVPGNNEFLYMLEIQFQDFQKSIRYDKNGSLKFGFLNDQCT